MPYDMRLPELVPLQPLIRDNSNALAQMMQFKQSEQNNQLRMQRDNALQKIMASGLSPDDTVKALIASGNLKAAQAIGSVAASQAATRSSETRGDLAKLKYHTELLAKVQSQEQYDAFLQGLEQEKPGSSQQFPPQFDPAFVAREVASASDVYKQSAPPTKAEQLAHDDRVAGREQTGRHQTATEEEVSRHHLAMENAQGGVGPDGQPMTNEDMVTAIGEGRMPSPTGFALRSRRAMKIMAEVTKKYPDYDAAGYGTRAKARTAFTTGREAQMMRSLGTAVKHLDQLDELGSALENGNIQLLNKIGNQYNMQVGDDAKTNFDAVKQIVGQEVVKSIVLNGGGVTERQEAATAINDANSPPQLRGVIKNFKNIMSAQHESLVQQATTAGIKESDLPDYTAHAGGKTAPTAKAPTGVDAAVWNAMTPAERKLWD